MMRELAPLLLILTAPALGFYLGWITANIGWHTAYRCRECGHASRYLSNAESRLCKRCGENAEHTKHVRRARIFGYEYKDSAT